MINLTAKLGELTTKNITRIAKYPQNHVILDCIMPNIPLKHKCLSIILIWVKVVVVSKKIFFFTFLNWEFTDMVLEKRWLFSIGNWAEIRLLEKDRKCPEQSNLLNLSKTII